MAIGRKYEFDHLIHEVVALTRRLGQGNFLALYAYGSAVRGDADDWSDLDVFLISRDGDEALRRTREWMQQVYDRFQFQVDPIAMAHGGLGAGVPDEYASFLWSLRKCSRLLWGKAMIEEACLPTFEQLQRAAVQVALLCIRRLYSTSRDRPIPDALPLPDAARCQDCPAGNYVWQVVTAIVQSLRALLTVEGGGYCESKSEIADRLRARGEFGLAGLCDTARQIRGRVPRMGPVDRIPSSLATLRQAIPVIYGRLRRAMIKIGMVDPTHEPQSG